MDNMTEIKGLQFYNNSMIDSISVLMISRLPQHFLLIDSNLTNNNFSNSLIIRMVNFEMIEKDRKHEYSVLLIQNITLFNTQVRNSKSLFDLWSYFVLVIDSHFKNIKLMSGTFFTLRGGKGIDYQQVDIDYINETFVNYPKLSNLLLYCNYHDRPFEVGDAVELQHRFESNVFEDCALNFDSRTDQDIDYSFYDISLIEVTGFTYYLDYVLFIDNQFTRTNIKDIESGPFILIKSVSLLNIKQNIFQDINASIPTLFTLENLRSQSRVKIIENSMHNISGPGFVSLILPNMSWVTFSENTLLNSRLVSSYILFSAKENYYQQEFINNSIHNCSFVPKNNEFIRILFEKSTNDTIFKNFTVKNFSVFGPDDNQFTYINFAAAISISLDRSQFILSDSNIEIMDNGSSRAIISIIAEHTKIVDTTVMLSGSSKSNNIFFRTSNIKIANVSYLHNVIGGNSNLATIVIYRRLQNQTFLNISITNNSFSFSNTSSNILLQVRSTGDLRLSTTVRLQNNSFKSEAKNVPYRLINFNGIDFQQFRASDNNITLRNTISGGNWLEFSGCSGEVFITNNTIFLEEKNGLIFTLISYSINLTAQLTDNQVVLVENTSSYEQTFFQLLNADSGNITVQNFILQNVNLTSPIFMIKNTGLGLVLQLKNISIINLEQSILYDVKMLIQKPPQEDTGIIFLKGDRLESSKQTTSIFVENSRFQNVSIKGNSGILTTSSSSEYIIYFRNTWFLDLSSEQGAALNIRFSEIFSGMLLKNIKNCSFITVWKVENGTRYFFKIIWSGSVKYIFI